MLQRSFRRLCGVVVSPSERSLDEDDENENDVCHDSHTTQTSEDDGGDLVRLQTQDKYSLSTVNSEERRLRLKL